MDGWDLVDPKIKRIVDVLSFNKDKLYHLKQLAVDARVSHATTFRIMKTLVKLNYVSILKIGKLKLYKTK
ncbi:MAG TPA: hypothetical protein VJK72_03285 [Candidatus Nanoarchaeia archaeon]|nr:hypothetical protein [Candidatus Nanoarchaeia archaeon]